MWGISRVDADLNGWGTHDYASELDKAKLQGKKLMKQIAFDLAELFAGLAAYYQPVPAADGTLTGNPLFNEEKFKEYAVLARDTALGAAAYQSPKLATVAVGVDANNPLRLRDDITLEEIRRDIAIELEKLGPILDLEAIRDPQGIESRIPVVANGVAEDEGAPETAPELSERRRPEEKRRLMVE